MSSELNQNPMFLAACFITGAATIYAQDEEGKKWTTKYGEAFEFNDPTKASRIATPKAGSVNGMAKIIDTSHSALPSLPIRLKFAPETVKELQEILEDKTAWTLWLLWKAKHITNQVFNNDVLAIAKRIRKDEPKNDGELRACMERGLGFSNFPSNDVFNFCREAFPFFIGEAEVKTERAEDKVKGAHE